MPENGKLHEETTADNFTAQELGLKTRNKMKQSTFRTRRAISLSQLWQQAEPSGQRGALKESGSFSQALNPLPASGNTNTLSMPLKYFHL